MLQYETYTVYLRGFEGVGAESGLSFTNAFRRVLSLAGRPCEFEESAGAVSLMFRDDGIPPIVSRAPIDSDAKREVMLAAMDGRFGFAAVQDRDFYGLPRIRINEPVMLDSFAGRFLLRAVIADRAHRFPGVSVPQRGHAKAGFDMGLAIFSEAVAERLGEIGIAWMNMGRT